MRLAPLLLLGCTLDAAYVPLEDASPSVEPAAGWWDDGSPSDGPAPQDDASDDDPDEDDRDAEPDDDALDDDDAEPDDDDTEPDAEHHLFVELEYDGAAVIGGVQGWYVEDADGVACGLEYELVQAATVTGCTACTMAFEVRRGAAEVFVDDGTCAALGYLGLRQTTMRVGFGGDTAFLFDGQTWQPAGIAEVEPDFVYVEVDLAP